MNDPEKNVYDVSESIHFFNERERVPFLMNEPERERIHFFSERSEH